MICFSVHKNGEFICNAGMPDLTLLTAHIHGSRFDAAAGIYEVRGMQELPGDRKAHVGWVHEGLLKPGDSLIFVLIDHDEPDAPSTFKPTDSADYLREQGEYEALLQGHMGPEPSLPQLRSEIAFTVNVRDQEVTARLSERDTHMMCSLLWDKWSPDVCKVSVRSFPSAATGAAGERTDWLRADMRVGDSFEITLLA